MTRPRQRRQAAAARYGNIDCRAADHFIAGAEWADANPSPDIVFRAFVLAQDYEARPLNERDLTPLEYITKHLDDE